MGKGFKLPQRTARLVFEGDYAGAEVMVRLDVSLGLLMHFLELQATAERLAAGDTSEALEVLKVYGMFAEAALVSWNLETDAGVPIPATMDGMEQVTPAFAELLMKEWVEVSTTPPAPLGEQSSNGSTSAEVMTGVVGG